MSVMQCPHSRVVAAALLWLAAAALAQVQPAPKAYEPKPYQEGKDVVWLPTPQELVDKMLDLAKVTASDYVIDLGSGDGRTVITAAKRGARAMGIEYNPDMVEYSTRAAAKEGLAGKVRFMKADLFDTDFSDATVVTMYLLPDINLKLRPKILDLKPGTRVVSHAFNMGEWKPDRSVTVNGKTAYLWFVPAKVAGVWRLPQGELTFRQNFQAVTGTLKTGERTVPVSRGRLRGDRITFSVGDDVYRGNVNANSIEGIVKSGGTEAKWNATRGAAGPAASTR